MTADTREKKPGKRARAAGAGQEPLVSVIVPVYNVCAYLEESLDSVLRQSHERLEILIVDDGSTDGSGEICERYAEKDPRIRVFRQNNRGLSAARNVGLDNASGEYIAFLDSDDAFHERMIQTLLDVLRLQKADIAVCGVSVHRTEGRMKPDEQGAARSRSRLADRDEALRICLDGGIDSAPWNKLYAGRIWESLRFPEGRVFEGTYTVLTVLEKAARIAVVDEKLVMHRDRPGSICNTCSLKNIQDGVYARERFLQFVREHTPEVFSMEQQERTIRTCMWNMIGNYLKYVCKNPDDTEGEQAVRDMLIRTFQDSDRGDYRLLTRTSYRLALAAPRFGARLYGVYARLNKALRLVRQR